MAAQLGVVSQEYVDSFRRGTREWDTKPWWIVDTCHQVAENLTEVETSRYLKWRSRFGSGTNEAQTDRWLLGMRSRPDRPRNPLMRSRQGSVVRESACHV